MEEKNINKELVISAAIAATGNMNQEGYQENLLQNIVSVYDTMYNEYSNAKKFLSRLENSQSFPAVLIGAKKGPEANDSYRVILTLRSRDYRNDSDEEFIEQEIATDWSNTPNGKMVMGQAKKLKGKKVIVSKFTDSFKDKKVGSKKYNICINLKELN
jgi:ribosomal protein L35AE/L33A